MISWNKVKAASQLNAHKIPTITGNKTVIIEADLKKSIFRDLIFLFMRKQDKISVITQRYSIPTKIRFTSSKWILPSLDKVRSVLICQNKRTDYNQSKHHNFHESLFWKNRKFLLFSKRKYHDNIKVGSLMLSLRMHWW